MRHYAAVYEHCSRDAAPSSLPYYNIRMNVSARSVRVRTSVRTRVRLCMKKHDSVNGHCLIP